MLNPISTTTYKDQPKQGAGFRFSAADLGEIENMAKGLAREEILGYFMMEDKDLTADEKVWFEKAYTRGRTRGKIQAVDSLFKQMNNNEKQGAQAALSYLRKFAKDFEGAEDINPGQALHFTAIIGDGSAGG